MECRLIGWPADGPQLDLEHERFAYAGKFVMTGTGKAIATSDGEILAAVAFNRDRTTASVWWLRTVTVRADRQGESIGPRLLDFMAAKLLDRGRAIRIAVNNPFAYEAAYKAGFGYTGETTGLAELVLERPADRSPTAYRCGLERFRARDRLRSAEDTFLADRRVVPPLVSDAQ